MTRSWLTFSLFTLCVAATISAAVKSQQRPSGDHSAHRKMMDDPPRYARSFESYRVPEITLVNQDGSELGLAALLESSRPVALNFIFTTCTTICPVMTATFAQMLRELGPDAEGLRVVSISIDPEYDSPAVLKKYAETFKATEDWQFLTGEMRQIVTLLKTFDAYAGSKMNHRPITFFRGPESERWLRIEGLANGAELASEYRQLLHE